MATKKTTTVNKSSVIVKGSNSTSVIDVIKVYGNSNTVNARNGNDQITVYKGKKHKIYGGAGKDTITIAKAIGTGNKIYGDAGNDTIKINGGNSNIIYGGAGNDAITLAGGKSNKIYGQTGVDTIIVKGGSGNYIYGGAGNDKITISGGTGQKVFGETGDDTITVSGGNKHALRGGKGSDSYVVSAAISKGTRLSLNQVDIVSGDIDTLHLKKANRGDVKFDYNSSTNVLTATHKTGGAITVKNWTKNPLEYVLFSGKSSYYVLAGDNSKTLTGTGGDDYILAGSANKTVKAGGGSDKIRIIGGSGQTVNTGTGNDSVYVEKGSVKSIVNAGGTDYIEIGKNAGNEIKVQSGTGDGKLVAKETVKVLGGNKHYIELYGGNDKVIVAGGSGHVVYTDGPTGSGDAGDNDVIVIQSGGQAKSIVAGNGNDVIAIANGADDGSTIYTGVKDPNNVNTGTGINTVNILGGKDHIIYLGGTENKVLIEAQNVTLNKYAGTSDDIRVRWSEQGTGTLRINCPSVSSSKESTLRIEGAKSWQFEFYNKSVDIKNANGVVSETVDALVMKFVGQYNRDTRSISGNYQWNGDNEGNTRLPVYVNGNGLIQYNWCAGNQQISYNPTPVATGGSIEITRWNSDATRVFDSITFDDGSFGYSAINIATTRDTHSIALG